MKILVIFENIPDESFIAVLEMTPEEWFLHEPLAGAIVNSQGCPLTPEQIDLHEKLGERCKAANRDLTDTSVNSFNGVINRILWTGFFL